MDLFSLGPSTQASYLSAADKRKLCCAIAMIGTPQLLLLDEPTTTSFPPSTQKAIWHAVRSQTSATLYCTQNLAEAEAVSDKLAIMVKGLFKCYGTLSEIKKEYGSGYDI